ncbi:hypothetical protein [uncultured Winogradskyella sp.]|uniref:FEKKY domain-containing protein n=1 Tax=uncultured Winogradskyella sp. TaxID=395353 RepID=UPI00262F3368|nr:hypothetical protein [uncultured Winogradskyella sp.]
MNSKTKYLLLILVIAGIILLKYNDNNALTETSFDPPELKYSKWLFGIGILCAGLYLFRKAWRNILTKIMIGTFGVCFALNLYLFIEIYPYVQINKRYAEYSEIETCEEMEKRFSTDLKNGEVKYFHFGIGTLIGQNKILKDNYNIEVYSMGCLVQTEMECYNENVNDYLKKKYDKSMSDIFNESDFIKLLETE